MSNIITSPQSGIIEFNTGIAGSDVFGHSAPIRLDATGGDIWFTGSNVGIETNSPQFTLDVNGAIHGTSGNFQTAITVGGNPVMTGASPEADTLQTVTNRGATTTNSVGIGTTSANGLLQVGKYTVASQGNQGTYGNLSSFANSDTDNIFLGLKNGSYPNRGFAFRTVAVGVNSDFTIYEHGQGSAEVFRITANGNVGIGTNSPYAYDTTATKLHVKNAGSSGSISEVARLEGASDADGSGAILRIGTSNDRGIYLEGGRTGSVPYASIGTTEYNGAKTEGIRITSTGTATFAGAVTVGGHILPSTSLSYDLGSDSKRFASAFCHGLSASSSVTTPIIQLQGNLKILNKAQTSYLDLATRDTSGSEVRYNLNYVGHVSLNGELNFTTNSDKYIDVNTIANGNSFNIRHHNPTGNVFKTAFQSAANGATTLYYNGAARFATTTDGIQLYGNGYLDMPDNGRIRLGASYDLAIYHDASHSYIDEVGTGDLRIRSNSATALLSSTNENMLVAIANGAVELYYDNSKKLETTSSGITVTGGITLGGTGRIQGIDTVTDGTDAANKTYVDNAVGGSGGPFLPLAGGTITGNVRFNDNKVLEIGSSADLSIYHDGTDSYLKNTVGHLFIRNDANDKNIIFVCDDGSGGITSYITLDGSAGYTTVQKKIRFADSVFLELGSGGDIEIYHNGSNSYINNNGSGGHLFISNYANDKDIVLGTDDGSGGVTPYLTLDGSHTQMLATKNLHFDDNVELRFGNYASPDLKIYHDGSDSYIRDLGTGELRISGSKTRIYDADLSSLQAEFIDGGSVDLYYDSNKKFETTISGVAVSTTTTATLAIQSGSNNAEGSKMRLTEGATYNGGFIHYDGSANALKLGVHAPFNSTLSDDTNVITIPRDTGNVGIGTTSPSDKLDVVGDNAKIFLQSADYKIARIQPRGTGANLDKGLFSLFDGSTEDVRIDTAGNSWFNGGNVGIGQGSPSKKLDVNGAAIFGAGTTRLTTYSDSGYAGIYNGSSLTSDESIYMGGGNMFFYGDGAETIRILANGNVGIGTPSPARKLTIKTSTGSRNNAIGINDASGTEQATIALDTNTNDVSIAGKANLRFYSGSTLGGVATLPTNERVVITTAGNVGIGTTSPQAYLDIRGGGAIFSTTLTNNDDWQNSPVSILERGVVGSAQSADKYSPNLNFHWTGRVSTSLWMNSSGYLNWGSFGSTGIPTADGVFQTNTINLIGTGRITGVDTVSASTDAANKAYVDAQVGSADTLQEVTDNGNTTTNSITMTNSLTIDGEGSSSDVLKLKGSARIQVENASGNDSFYISNTGGSGASKLDLGGAVSIIEGGEVGIGTTSPDSGLHLQGASNTSSGFTIENTSGGTSKKFGFQPQYNDDRLDIWYNSNATAAITVKDGGNVGIGSTGPAYKLDVNGHIGLSSQIYFSAATAGIQVGGSWGNGVLNFRNGATTAIQFDVANGRIQNNLGKYLTASSGTGQFGTLDNQSVAIVANNSTKMTILSGGNVGIGTVSPAYNLTIADTLTSTPKTLLHFDANNITNGGGYNIDFRTSSNDTADRYVARIRGIREGNGATSQLSFWTENSGLFQRMTIKADGNVGIGTTSPTAKLYIEQQGVSWNATTQGPSVGTIHLDPVGDGAEDTGNAITFGASDTGNGATAQAGIYIRSDGSYGTKMYLSTTDSYASGSKTRLMINHNGNVGIGTTNPAAKLDVYSAASFRADVATGNPLISIVNNTATSNTAGTATIKFTQANTQAGGKIVSGRDGNYSSGATRTSNLQFYTSTAASDTEKMRIDSAGKIQIGNNIPMWSGSYGGALFLKGNNANSDRYAQLTEVDSTGAATSYGLVVRGGKVGIGTTTPDASTLLHVQGVIGTTNGSAAAPTHSFYGDPDNGMFRAAANALGFSTSGAERMRISSTGEVVIYSNQLSVINSTGAQLQVSGWSDRVGSNNNANGTIYIGNTAAYRGVIDYDAASTGDLIISNTWNNANGDIVFKTATAGTAIEGLRIKGGGNVGIGADAAYKLEVNGGILAGGKVTYHKSAGSLNTTGYAVAGLVAGSNGMSAGFTFTCFGHTGDYQKIVYSCYNASGTWNTQKVIDEGTNDFDVTASANGSTITFTFKSRSGTKSYTPRVSVEAFGSSINNTYA